jgi:hypothetical protein
MPEVIETIVYRLDELDDDAKEKARAWYREGGFDNDWYDAVYADFEAICGLIGVALRVTSVRLMSGGSRQKPCIYFRGFWSQGDGACFEGEYTYARNARAKIRAYAPKDADLHEIVDALQAVQQRNFYQLRAMTRHRGHYYHEYCMDVAVERAGLTRQDMTHDAEEIVIEAVRNLARWLYRQLEQDYEYQTSDASVDQTMAANAYTFTGTGLRFG